MKNKTLYIVIGVVVVVVIVVVAVWHGSGQQNGAASSTQNGTAQSGAAGTTPMSLASLLTAGTSRQCGFSTQNSDRSVITGTVYVTTGHLRGDFSVKNASGTLTQNHIITDGTNAYVWTDTPAQGIEMSFASMSSPSAQAQSGSVNPNTQMNYSCTSWGVDASEFTLPTNINFMNMTNMTGATASGTGMSASCGMCAEAGSAANQAACRAAMHC